MRYLLFAVGCICFADGTPSSEPPLTDKRFTVHTLLREDVFAGFLDGDMDRLARGEKNIDRLMELRPAEKPVLLAWKAGVTLYRAVLALEAKKNDEFEQKYKQAIDLFAEAKKLSNDPAIAAITGGVYAVFADRLPQKVRASSWAAAYESYAALWKQQGKMIKQLPPHLSGELLAGLAQSAQRTGRAKESADYVEQILAVLPNTNYAKAAKKWKDDPKAAMDTSLACQSCHSAGRLAARKAALEGK